MATGYVGHSNQAPIGRELALVLISIHTIHFHILRRAPDGSKMCLNIFTLCCFFPVVVLAWLGWYPLVILVVRTMSILLNRVVLFRFSYMLPFYLFFLFFHILKTRQSIICMGFASFFNLKCEKYTVSMATSLGYHANCA